MIDVKRTVGERVAQTRARHWPAAVPKLSSLAARTIFSSSQQSAAAAAAVPAANGDG